MKIYKVNLDPSNPVENIVKVPVGEEYGLEVSWDGEKYPDFSPISYQTWNVVGIPIWCTAPLCSKNARLTNIEIKCVEDSGNISYCETYSAGCDTLSKSDFSRVYLNTSYVSGYKIKDGEKFDVFTEVGQCVEYKLVPALENFKDNMVNFDNKTYPLYNWGGTIKVVGVDSDDYDVDVGGSSYEGISETDGRIEICSNTIYIAGSNVDLNGNVVVNGDNVLVSTGDNSNFIGYCMPAQTMFVGQNLCNWSTTKILSLVANENLNIDAGNNIRLGTSESITIGYSGCGSTTVHSEMFNIGCSGSPTRFSINGTQICLTKFLADYGM